MNRISCIFKNQQVFQYQLRKTNAAERIEKLRKLKAAIQENEGLIYTALQRDLRKNHFEAAVTELIFTYGEIDFAIKNLKGWMSPKRIGKSLSNPFAKNRIYYEPKGVCLIIAPWNYPFQLVMSPLVSAIAAGNCVIIKPSEISANTSKAIAKIIIHTFEEEEVACVEGNATVAGQLLELPFDHIFFTGSTGIGKLVMAAAAKNLTSVTLELGGKSPTIIDKEVDLEKAARKIAWGKLVNSGQTCIAPDYILIHEQRLDEFIGLYKIYATTMYFKSKEEINPNTYGKIINQKHFDRLNELVNEAVEKGARINWGGKSEEKTHTIYPVLLSQIPSGCRVMEEEIFGPVLPIITYGHLDEAIDKINAKSKPLALYIFSNNSKNIKHILKNTSAGGTCINDVLIHLANPKLPFGGVNGSGMGSSHGFFGFKNFSHERAIVTQRKPDFNAMIYPPYQKKNWVLNLLKKIM
jgi:aldehyde dehydrogenase (NAD+)